MTAQIIPFKRINKKKLVACSFCGRSIEVVPTLIQAQHDPSKFICRYCVRTCNDRIKEEVPS